ncbi:2-amino-4-hydroxy-6-hydroxymethyldihydropteridine diphosphokinase [Paenibacillus shirakamiensis]|uniref:2-amino-4-hydroxy-6-hydroxymethyldihydropteridine diphosphokinase n=1 Tax=Paenibacillus shirakamiensis TaxID=1265935 RepID=A0ABS4JLZ3_9BACL|nr:2-amino-4-hydroxy-6-hydroxymethyldihydropteridine diphosphokinase [Paenibacillus shirakamiensis]MBP2002732.1 2-amino-4-hydroxy-6-hydroxymethyldihydropteridine diphosphokinase [Paenibacillus shirakamiensis]
MNAHSTSEHSEAYIALGANLGDREHTLLEAIERLNDHPCVTVLRCSNLYETEPVGYLDQPNFVNMAIAVSTNLSPEELLKVMLQIELDLGRERHIRWGPRTVDLDLLWVDGMSLDTPFLTLPHPRMMERAFVIVPLHDIVSSLDTTGLYPLVKELIETGIGKEGIFLWKTCSWPNAFEHFVN